MSGILSSVVQCDAVALEISKDFDYQFDGRVDTTIPSIPQEVPRDFSIGLIVGPSGSGKSTILKDFGEEDNIPWDPTLAVCSNFPNATEAREKLSAAGMNSIPDWMKPFHVLSTGQKFRADLARRLRSGAVIDEFTSTVDRPVAKSCSYAMSRYIRNVGLKGIVFASCHYDIIPWLRPDWVFDLNTQTLARGDLHPPEIKVALTPTTQEVWPMFRNHHYLTGEINKSSQCWIATWEGIPVGFSAILSYPSGSLKNAWRESRVVVLPDYQGLGIGVSISEATGEIIKLSGGRFFSKTAHPRLGGYRDHSAKWRKTSKNKKARRDYTVQRTTKEDKHKMLHRNRICYSHEYIGETS